MNKDLEGPVFQIADVCIVEDVVEFIQLFIKKLKKV
jgi:electron transfer flavoprotein alpha subunit